MSFVIIPKKDPKKLQNLWAPSLTTVHISLVGWDQGVGGGGVHVQTLPKAKRTQGLNVLIKETSLLVHLVGNHLVQCTMIPILT